MNKITSREFNQNRSRARKAAQSGPVIITDRGKPSYVFITYQDYEQIRGQKTDTQEENLLDLIGMPDGAEIEFEPGRLGSIARSVDFD